MATSVTWTRLLSFFCGSWDRPGSAAVPSARDEPRMTDTVLTGRLERLELKMTPMWSAGNGSQHLDLYNEKSWSIWLGVLKNFRVFHLANLGDDLATPSPMPWSNKAPETMKLVRLGGFGGSTRLLTDMTWSPVLKPVYPNRKVYIVHIFCLYTEVFEAERSNKSTQRIGSLHSGNCGDCSSLLRSFPLPESPVQRNRFSLNPKKGVYPWLLVALFSGPRPKATVFIAFAKHRHPAWWDLAIHQGSKVLIFQSIFPWNQQLKW